MSPEKHIEKLEKTRKSIITHVGNGGNSRQRRAQELIGRYNDHVDVLKRKYPEHWKEYCKKNGSHPSHDGYDMYA